MFQEPLIWGRLGGGVDYMCVGGVCMWKDKEYSGRVLSLSNGRMAGSSELVSRFSVLKYSSHTWTLFVFLSSETPSCQVRPASGPLSCCFLHLGGSIPFILPLLCHHRIPYQCTAGLPPPSCDLSISSPCFFFTGLVSICY